MKKTQKVAFKYLNKIQFLKTLRIIVLVYFLFWITTYLVENKMALIAFTEIEIISIAFLILIYFSSMLFSTLQFQAILKYCNCQVRSSEVFWLNAYNSAINLLLPLKSGIAFRGYYLNKKYALPWKKYIYASLASQLLLMLIPLLLSFFLYCFYYLNLNFSLSVVSFIVCLLSLIIISDRYIKYLRSINNENKGLGSVVFLLIYSFGFIFSWSVLLYFCFIFLGYEYSFHQVFLLQSLLLLTSLINLTPGNIGVKEGAAFLMASYLDINNDHAVFALLLERSIYSIIIIIFGGVGLLTNKLKTK
ncbi:lysylphosphatidylglycerol synthase domain-containing protein [Thalassotalea piscium]